MPHQDRPSMEENRDTITDSEMQVDTQLAPEERNTIPTAETRRRGFIMPYIKLLFVNNYYRSLWLSGFVSLMGDWFNFIATIALVEKYIHSKIALSILLICRLLSPAIAASFSGVIVDRFDRRMVMLVCDIVRFFVVMGFLVVRDSSTAYLLFVLTFFQHFFAGVFEPAKSGLLPSVVKREDIVTANALDATTWSVTSGLGSALGGIITVTLGFDSCYIMDAGSFILSAFFLMQLFVFLPSPLQFIRLLRQGVPWTDAARQSGFKKVKLPIEGSADAMAAEERVRLISSEEEMVPAEDPGDGEMLDEEDKPMAILEIDNDKADEPAEEAEPIAPVKRENFGRMFVNGLRYMIHYKDLAILLFAKASMAFVWGALDQVSIILAENEFKLNWTDDGASFTVGLLYGAIGLGTLVGPLIAQKLARDTGVSIRFWLFMGYILAVIGGVLATFSWNLWVMLLGSGIIRPAGEGITWVYSGALLQLGVADSFRGRVFAMESMIRTILQVLSTLGCGMLFDYVGWNAFQISGVYTGVAILNMLFWGAYFLHYRGKHSPEEPVLKYPPLPDTKNAASTA